MDLTWLLVMLAIILDHKEISQRALGDCTSRKARHSIGPSFEILVILGQPLHVLVARDRSFE